jgi:hypothetical protein
LTIALKMLENHLFGRVIHSLVFVVVCVVKYDEWLQVVLSGEVEK